MAKIKIKLNRAGVGELLKSTEVTEFVGRLAERIANTAGPGYDYRKHFSGQRYIHNVYAETFKARRDNLKNNTLVKAMRSSKET